ncbi:MULTISPECIES: hypothetical protein [unclassified Paenibacillus]
MKQIFALILMLALALSAFVFFVTGGLWNDAHTLRDNGHQSITDRLAPPN